ncbi:MAG: hypothetical protein LBT09_14345 [Planctomycetaceae bacterium]|nr:hypothetical protein [Planctomycetaceae bacterium]
MENLSAIRMIFAGRQSVCRAVAPVDRSSNENPVDLKFKRKDSPTGK